ncbi:Glycine/D-amino acid oxidase [Halopenitus malekzadehii]|uniref:Glycine/D-amino acid oxidase n=1 Tax=Halopenitus malekzadehii TaxID=1267564 RepID=A0A1H6HR60_9EURY|nr:FAD-dependent oxidoreductase [Halopenitus malekzadehii]SEH36610.1 Glycine/D-amino acid oxidase [Halopenitus malekzadehii]
MGAEHDGTAASIGFDPDGTESDGNGTEIDDDTGSGKPRVVVIGGGIIGCMVARELADTHRVLVLERDGIAQGATARAAGEITMIPSYPDYPSIATHGLDFFRSYDGTGAFEFAEIPSVELVTPEREETVRARVERQRGNGVDVAFIEADDARKQWPGIDMDEFVGVARYHGTGHVDPYTLATTVQAEAAEAGARFETDVTVTEMAVAADRDEVTGVETDQGFIACDHVVAAAGWRTRDLLAPHLQLPVRPYRTQCIVLRPPENLPASFPMGWIPGEHVYFRPEANGDLLVGGWSFAEDDPDDASRSADEAFRDHVADLVPRFVDSPGAMRLVDGWAGVDGATPDTRPIIDAPADAPDGLIVATGFHGRGIMTSPIAATLVRCLLEGSDPPFPRDPFELDRFEDRSPDFEFVSISAGN